MNIHGLLNSLWLTEYALWLPITNVLFVLLLAVGQILLMRQQQRMFRDHTRLMLLIQDLQEWRQNHQAEATAAIDKTGAMLDAIMNAVKDLKRKEGIE